MDPHQPRVGPPEGSVLLYPSFLKQLSGAVMQQIWHAAGEALATASRIDVYGYSLPESDSAVRTLLNVLRFRSESEMLRLSVHDPSLDAQERWRSFLGRRAVVDARLVEEVLRLIDRSRLQCGRAQVSAESRSSQSLDFQRALGRVASDRRSQRRSRQSRPSDSPKP